MAARPTSRLTQQTPRRAAEDLLPPHLTAEGEIRRPELIAPANWRDPDDAEALERGPNGRRHQRTIKGYRRIDPIDRLPCDADHIKAVARLRKDWEMGSGQRTGGTSERVDGGNKDYDGISIQLEARRRYESAVQTVGARGCRYMIPVVLGGWTVGDLVTRHGGNAMATQGRVMSALDRLVEHYEPPTKEHPIITPPTLMDAITQETDLPPERLGRWK